jgi:hypothetical protein
MATKLNACLIAASFVVTGCTGKAGGEMAERCSRGLATAGGELQSARVRGLGGTANWTKAASLLTAAKIQYEFEHYPNCVDKVRRARFYLHRMRG